MKIVWLGKKHFLKTKSDQFLITLLQEFAEVVVLRREDYSSWQLFWKVKKEKPDWLLFYATPPSVFHHILRFPLVKKVFIPMYDGFKAFKPLKEAIFRFFRLQVISFSKPMTEYLQGMGLKTLDVRYFPQPEKRLARGEGPYRFFFWQRGNGLPQSLVKKVVGSGEILERNDQSPWLAPEELKKLLQQSDFYIAPRKQEGIGMSFLEALALGIPVIGYNDHTMKDYIIPGKNGYLFDETTEELPLELLPDFSEMNQKFYRRWQEDKKRISAFFFTEKSL